MRAAQLQPMASDTNTVVPGERQAALTLRGLRLLGLLIFAAWVWRYMRVPEPILHGSILIFHEAGHVVFMPFGEFMTVLGGSLFQLLVPAGIIGYFIWRRDFFAASFASIYLAASMANLAVYIGDARAGRLPLLGGHRSSHDWTYLLIEMKRLGSDMVIGDFVHSTAVTLFGVAVVAGIWFASHTAPQR